MTIWVDSQLSPVIAEWLAKEFSIEAKALRDIGLRDAEDEEIFYAARKHEQVIILSKDIDFVKLIEAHGTPPFLIWLICGNTSNEKLKEILSPRLKEIIELFLQGESIVEVR